MKRRCQALYWIKKGSVQVQCNEKTGKSYEYWGDRSWSTLDDIQQVKVFLCKKHSATILVN